MNLSRYQVEACLANQKPNVYWHLYMLFFCIIGSFYCFTLQGKTKRIVLLLLVLIHFYFVWKNYRVYYYIYKSFQYKKLRKLSVEKKDTKSQEIDYKSLNKVEAKNEANTFEKLDNRKKQRISDFQNQLVQMSSEKLEQRQKSSFNWKVDASKSYKMHKLEQLDKFSTAKSRPHNQNNSVHSFTTLHLIESPVRKPEHDIKKKQDLNKQQKRRGRYNLFQISLKDLDIQQKLHEVKCKKIKENFKHFLSKNLQEQIDNLTEISRLIQQAYDVKFVENTNQTKFKSESQATIFLSQSNFIQQCIQQKSKNRPISEIIACWKPKISFSMIKKVQDMLEQLIDTRIKLDMYLNFYRAFITANKINRNERIQYIKYIIKNLEANQEAKSAIFIQSNQQFTQRFEKFLLNFMVVKMWLIQANPPTKLIPKIDPLFQNQKEEYILFEENKQDKKAQNIQYDITVKYKIDEQPQAYTCLPGKDNFWSALLFYVYAVRKHFPKELDEYPKLKAFLKQLI